MPECRTGNLPDEEWRQSFTDLCAVIMAAQAKGKLKALSIIAEVKAEGEKAALMGATTGAPMHLVALMEVQKNRMIEAIRTNSEEVDLEDE